MEAMMKAAMTAAAVLLAAAGSASFPAAAQTGERVSRLVIYGNDPCPRSTDEIVVCARRPESERYRIPEALREGSDNPENESWAARAQSLEYVGRTGIQSCSTVGPGGFTGCWAEMMRQAREERRAAATQPRPR
jgi:hypothetical protein